MAGRTLRALVVEDEQLLAAHMADALGTIGLSVVGVSNSYDDAIRQLDKPDAFDIAFIDLYLGREYHGLDLAKLATQRSIAVVLVTGQLSHAISDTLSTLKSVALLIKPFSIEQLKAVVAAVRKEMTAPDSGTGS